MNTTALSIVTPVYNVAPFLAECLDSVLARTFADFELICINDGSTDDSLQILEAYASQVKRIRIISQPNGGYGKAMNTGFDAAAGRYIAIVESDDYIAAPDMFEKLMAAAEPSQCDFVKCCYKFFGIPTVNAPFPESELALTRG